MPLPDSHEKKQSNQPVQWLKRGLSRGRVLGSFLQWLFVFMFEKHRIYLQWKFKVFCIVSFMWKWRVFSTCRTSLNTSNEFFITGLRNIMLEIVVHTKIKILTNSTKNRETVQKNKQTNSKQTLNRKGGKKARQIANLRLLGKDLNILLEWKLHQKDVLK